jgi:hypothetical protein
VDFDEYDIKERLLPLLSKDTRSKITDLTSFGNEMRNESKKLLSRVLPLKENELEFLERLTVDGDIRPSLITSNPDMIDKISEHPEILWKAHLAKERSAGRIGPAVQNKRRRQGRSNHTEKQGPKVAAEGPEWGKKSDKSVFHPDFWKNYGVNVDLAEAVDLGNKTIKQFHNLAKEDGIDVKWNPKKATVFNSSKSQDELTPNKCLELKDRTCSIVAKKYVLKTKD